MTILPSSPPPPSTTALPTFAESGAAVIAVADVTGLVAVAVPVVVGVKPLGSMGLLALCVAVAKCPPIVRSSSLKPHWKGKR